MALICVRFIASLPKVCTARPRVVVILRSLQPTIVATVGALFEVPLAFSEPFSTSRYLALDSFVGGFIGCLRSTEERFEIMRYSVRIVYIIRYYVLALLI